MIKINLLIYKAFVGSEINIKVGLQLFTDFQAARIIQIYRHYYLPHPEQDLLHDPLYLFTETASS